METNYWVIMPAAGSGERFDGELPKQYTKIHGKTILAHSLERFISQSWVKKIIVPIAENDGLFTKLPYITHPQVACIKGGETRAHSVMNALEYLKNHAQAQDWVLVHDAVRACLHEDDLMNLVTTLTDNQCGGLLCSKVTDTIKFSENNQVLHTVDRAPLWQALTPQMFRFEILFKVYADCFAQDLKVTDDCSAIEFAGFTPTIVEAKHPNPKLTYLKDLDIFAALLTKLSQTEEFA